jgi:hypothetical protein
MFLMQRFVEWSAVAAVRLDLAGAPESVVLVSCCLSRNLADEFTRRDWPYI